MEIPFGVVSPPGDAYDHLSRRFWLLFVIFAQRSGIEVWPVLRLALRKLKPRDREYLSTVSTNMSSPSLMAFLLLRRGSIFSIFFQDSRLKSFSGQTWIFLQEKRNDSSLFFLNIWKREMRLVVNRADWILILDVGTSSKSSLRISRVIKIIFRYFYIEGWIWKKRDFCTSYRNDDKDNRYLIRINFNQWIVSNVTSVKERNHESCDSLNSAILSNTPWNNNKINRWRINAEITLIKRTKLMKKLRAFYL